MLANKQIVMLLDNPFVSDARVEKEALALINAGAAVTVICTKEDDLPTLDERNGISIHRILGTDFNSPLRFAYRSFMQSQVNLILNFEFDVLHCHDFHMLALGAAVKKKKKSIKLIYDAHEYLIGWPFYQSSEKWQNRLKGRIVWNYLVFQERKNIKKADAVITITTGIAERLQKINQLKSTPVVVGNFIDKIDLKPNKRYFQEKYNLPTETKIILHTGTIYHTESQLKALFDGIRDQKNLVLVFIGNRPRFFELKKQVESEQFYVNKIFFHEYLSNQEDNIKLIASGDLGLMHIRDQWLAHQIGFSNRFVEYLMAEIPVLATPQEFTRQINSKYHCCVFYLENDIHQLKEGLKEILNKLPEYTENVKKANQIMDWETESLKLIEFYSSLNV